MTSSPEPVFEDSHEVPTGRKALHVPDYLWKALHDSAERGVAKITPPHLTADEVTQLRKHLTSAAVKAKFDVTTQKVAVENGIERLKFAATHKHQAKPAPAKSATEKATSR